MKFYVVDHVCSYGPYDHDTALAMQNSINAKYGVDSDGEGYCNAIVLTEGQARMLGKIK